MKKGTKTKPKTSRPRHDVKWVLTPYQCWLLLDDAKRRKSETVRLFYVGHGPAADHVECDLKIGRARAYRALGDWQLHGETQPKSGEYNVEVTVSCADVRAALRSAS